MVTVTRCDGNHNGSLSEELEEEGRDDAKDQQRVDEPNSFNSNVNSIERGRGNEKMRSEDDVFGRWVRWEAGLARRPASCHKKFALTRLM